jgi:hypothetical protein
MQIIYSVVAFVMAIAGTNAALVADANAVPVTTFAGPLTLDVTTLSPSGTYISGHEDAALIGALGTNSLIPASLWSRD